VIRRAFLCPALALAAAACGTVERSRTAVSDSAQRITVDPRTAAGQTALELWQLRAGLTLGDWKNAHPDEPILGADTSVLAAQFLGEWCAFAARRVTVGTRTVLRAAYFYAPPPPPGLAVPDSGASDLVRHCEMGLVWVAVEVPDSASGSALADSVRDQLARAWGAPARGGLSFWGSAWWSHTARFRKDSLVAVTALRLPPPRGPDAPGAVSRRSVIAFAFLPSSGVSVDSAPAFPGRAWTPVDTFPLDAAVAIAHLDTALWAPLRRRLREASAATPRGQPAESLITPLARWLAAAAPLPPPRRAAALYVADQVLERAMCRHRLCEDRAAPGLAQLRALGAQVVWSELGGTNVYARSWLNQARNLDRDSPLGQRMLLAQLAAGFDFSGTCAGGAEGFRKDIESAERYLERVSDSPIAPDVHYLAGEAWRDIVALARGAAGDYADSSRYGPEAADAARRALAHYGAAARAGAGSPAARAAWSRAWWLRAGLVPRDVRFYCVYD